MQKLPALIEATALYDAIKLIKSGLRILDCTFVPTQRPSLEQFQQNYYGKFAEQSRLDSEFKECYALFLTGHIPSAIYFNLNLATYPTQFQRFAYYPPKIFEEYARLIGLNSDDHLILYSGGPLSGMLYASRVYWLFKAYGHSGGLSILNGGMDSWLRHRFPFDIGDESDTVFLEEKGNWQAKSDPTSCITHFEELVKNENGKQLMNNKFLLLDSRPRQQFNGEQYSLDKTKPQPAGSHLPGAINIPSNELIDSQLGTLKSAIEIRSLLESGGIHVDQIERNQNLSIVSYCNAGMQASLLAAALDLQLGLKNVRVYNGSLLEMQIRAPELISEGVKHLDNGENEINNNKPVVKT